MFTVCLLKGELVSIFSFRLTSLKFNVDTDETAPSKLLVDQYKTASIKQVVLVSGLAS